MLAMQISETTQQRHLSLSTEVFTEKQCLAPRTYPPSVRPAALRAQDPQERVLVTQR